MRVCQRVCGNVKLKDKGKISYLDPLSGLLPCWHLGFNPVRLTLAFWTLRLLQNTGKWWFCRLILFLWDLHFMLAPVQILAVPFPIHLSAYGLAKQWRMAQVFVPCNHVGDPEEAPGFGPDQPDFSDCGYLGSHQLSFFLSIYQIKISQPGGWCCGSSLCPPCANASIPRECWFVFWLLYFWSCCLLMAWEKQ